ncbi:staygreen family protein [Cellulosilyticum ruminicola]|uniref:staygreen family protein n=1 Tax=Cellulosilyticum ruminicola TaxID=425254 RepID=UPI0006CF44CA|nr:staygreen family protein [Cellulosilyticum ruminicola]
MPFKRSRQIFVEYRDKVTKTTPTQNRTYTMTHSDETGDLFVTIGLIYADDMTYEIQDQVYLRFTPLADKWILLGEVLIDSEDFEGNKQVRYDIFKRKMPLALQAIYTADKAFFDAYPELKDAPILIRFKSTDSKYDKLYDYGSIGNYTTFQRYRPF